MKTALFVMSTLLSALAVSAADVAETAKLMLGKVTPGTIVYRAENGWLYSRNELAHLAKGELAKGRAATVSECRRKQNADPIPTLKAFDGALKALGIKLIVVPVPPKLAVEPCGSLKRGEAMVYLRPFHQELRAQGIDVLDLSEKYLADANEHYYCRTDAHWNPAGIAAAAAELAKRIDLRGAENFPATASEMNISGDLAKSLDPQKPEQEKIAFTAIGGKTVDETSPVLLIGDSHTLVFSTGGDMLAEHGGLAEQLALQLKMPVDRIGVKGSAATAVRINLYRKAARAPQWIRNKKFVIYCFSCREFTESSSGWVKVPVLRK